MEGQKKRKAGATTFCNICGMDPGHNRARHMRNHTPEGQEPPEFTALAEGRTPISPFCRNWPEYKDNQHPIQPLYKVGRPPKDRSDRRVVGPVEKGGSMSFAPEAPYDTVYMFLDLETTDIDAKRGEIFQIAIFEILAKKNSDGEMALKMDSIRLRYHAYYLPQGTFTKSAMNTTGFDMKRLEEMIGIGTLDKDGVDVINFILDKSTYIVAHNNSFELQHLRSAFRRADGETKGAELWRNLKSQKWKCTQELANKKGFRGKGCESLAALCKTFAIGQRGQHNAIWDAFYTLQIWVHLRDLPDANCPYGFVADIKREAAGQKKRMQKYLAKTALTDWRSWEQRLGDITREKEEIEKRYVELKQEHTKRKATEKQLVTLQRVQPQLRQDKGMLEIIMQQSIRKLGYGGYRVIGEGGCGYIIYCQNGRDRIVFKLAKYKPQIDAERQGGLQYELTQLRKIAAKGIKSDYIMKPEKFTEILDQETYIMRWHPNTLHSTIQNNMRMMCKGKRVSQSEKEKEKEKAIKILQGLLEGLDLLHEGHITHRDLKPGNILVAENGKPIIIDFGFSGSLGYLVGTPGYYAPEQRHQKAGQQGHLNSFKKTDIFQLGLCFYEYFGGQKGNQYQFEKVPLYAREMVEGMLQQNPNKRKTLKESMTLLKQGLESRKKADDAFDADLLFR